MEVRRVLCKEVFSIVSSSFVIIETTLWPIFKEYICPHIYAVSKK